jgi:hypothetical protein
MNRRGFVQRATAALAALGAGQQMAQAEVTTVTKDLEVCAVLRMHYREFAKQKAAGGDTRALLKAQIENLHDSLLTHCEREGLL